MSTGRKGKANGERYRLVGWQRPRQPARSGLGRSLDELRVHMGLSIPQLAAKLGWTPGLLAALIAGKITPSKGQHADLAKLARDYRKEREGEEDGAGSIA